MMVYVFKDDYEMSMLQVNQAMLTRLREGTQHDEVKDACIHSLRSNTPGDWKRDEEDQRRCQRSDR